MVKHGFIKANKLTNEVIIRYDILRREVAEKITVNSRGVARITKNDEIIDVMVEELFKVIPSRKCRYRCR